jgi:hypothetical protein
MANELYSGMEYNFKVITKNSAKCLECGDELISENRHGHIYCSCGNLSVDGGKSYLRRVFRDPTLYVDTSEYRKFTQDELLDYIHTYTKQFKENKLYSDSYYGQIINSAKYFLNLWYP